VRSSAAGLQSQAASVRSDDNNCVKGKVKHHKKDRDCYVSIRGCDKDGKHIVKHCQADHDGNYKFEGMGHGKWQVRVHFGRKC
jgi:hypothetical protein